MYIFVWLGVQCLMDDFGMSGGGGEKMTEKDLDGRSSSTYALQRRRPEGGNQYVELEYSCKCEAK
jgi:hypothetical protein